MKLYSYYRSSSAYRVRIALFYKNISFEYLPIHLIKDGGVQNSPEYLKVNPLKQVPALETKGGIITQSMAILLFLEDNYKPKLLPEDAFNKSKVLELCEIINSGIQPLQNLSVMQELKSRYKLSDEDNFKWSADVIKKGFTSLEAHLNKLSDGYCFKSQLTLADLLLVPQVYNANRFKVDMNPFPNITRVNSNCLNLEAFQKAHPDNQPDTPK